MSTNERLISLEGLATIRKNLTQDLAVPLLKQRMNPHVLPTALALLHELDLAESRENVLATQLRLTQANLVSLAQDYDSIEKDLEEADQAIVELIEVFEGALQEAEEDIKALVTLNTLIFKACDEACGQVDHELETLRSRVAELEDRNSGIRS